VLRRADGVLEASLESKTRSSARVAPSDNGAVPTAAPTVLVRDLLRRVQMRALPADAAVDREPAEFIAQAAAAGASRRR
jgi:hypothetical protein